ncbi:hypothetical protein ACWDUL_20085 [Nocardia niigatensis]
MPRRLILVAFAASVVMLTAAGCGSSRHGDETSTGSTPTVIDTVAPPNNLHWELWRGLQLPASPTDGPARTTDVVPAGYSRSPQGAVLAAIRGQAALALSRDTEWGQVLARLTAPGPGRDAFAVQRAALTIDGDVPAGSANHFVAFKVTAYHAEAPTTAAVRVVTRIGSDPKEYDYPVALQWLSGDWRIVLPVPTDGIDATVLTSLDGYTPLEQP